MKIRELSVPHAFEITPTQFPDDRGLFFEAFRSDQLAEAIGHRFDLAQVNSSVSKRGVVRGVHFAEVPPGQAKYVTCSTGAVLDFVIDIRVGSPTFGQWDSVLLDEIDRRAIYVAEGLGHAFISLADGSSVNYLVSSLFDAQREHGINPLDPDVGLVFPVEASELVLSPKDVEAPGLVLAREASLLPRWDQCLERYATLATG